MFTLALLIFLEINVNVPWWLWAIGLVKIFAKFIAALIEIDKDVENRNAINTLARLVKKAG